MKPKFNDTKPNPGGKSPMPLVVPASGTPPNQVPTVPSQQPPQPAPTIPPAAPSKGSKPNTPYY
jgi:hypothetical protein